MGGREFDPAIDFYAPPCTPGTPGAQDVGNGGVTSMGVSADTVTIIDYVTNYGAEINAVLAAEGELETYSQAEVIDKADQNFINGHYVLWGRKVRIITYMGQCRAAPPDFQCLLPEMDSVAATYRPYALLWDTTVCSACYEELARDHVVGFGGYGFTDELSNAIAPYFYTASESSTRMATAFAQWWCAQMSSRNVASRRVSFAGRQNPAQNFNGRPRVLGVVTPNDPDNENTVTNILQPALNRACGDGSSISAHHYYYAEDINTAAQQTSAGIAAMDTPTDPATDLLCLCDPVAPAFFYGGEQQHNYFPENLIASNADMDYDLTGQSYDASQPGNQPTLACPNPSAGCPFDNAVGLSEYDAQEPAGNDPGIRVYHLGGGTTNPGVTPQTATEIWENYNMMASLIENTGPDLTPQRMQAAAPSMGMRGGAGTGHYEVGFAPRDWQWIQDTRVVYWDPHRASSYNGQPGTYAPVEGRRFNLGQYPQLPDGPPVPSTRS